jgi:hypothetical protein
MDPDNKDTQVVLEQYKAYIADLGNFGTRYSRAHSLYFSLLGATVAVLGLTDSGRLLGGPLSGHVVWIVAAFGVGLCVLWLSTANYYRASFGAKFRVLRELESKLPVKPYTQETRYLGLSVDVPAEADDADKTLVTGPRGWIERQIKGPRPRILTSIERLIPVVFILLILALAYLAEKQPPPQQPAPVQTKKR